MKNNNGFRRIGETVWLSGGHPPASSVREDISGILVNTGITDSRYRPIVTVVSYDLEAGPGGDGHGDINAYVATDITFPSQVDGSNQWSFKILNSVGDGPATNTDSQLIDFRYQIMGFEPQAIAGPDHGSTNVEPHTGDDEFYTP